MAEAGEAKYLAQLRTELGSIDWLVFKRAEPTRQKRVSAATRFEALLDVARRNGIAFELLDAEVAR